MSATESTFSTLNPLMRPQWTFLSQILSHPMCMNPTHLMMLGLAFWDDHGDEGNLQCAKCELPSPHLARFVVLQHPNGLFSTKSFLIQWIWIQHIWWDWVCPFNNHMSINTIVDHGKSCESVPNVSFLTEQTSTPTLLYSLHISWCFQCWKNMYDRQGK